ncbi:MAG: hypothetical protein AABY13_04360, partial [Nanoarchaeota archaeon]
LQLYNLTFQHTPVVLVEGSVCRDCNTTGYAAGVFGFNVSHFSAYTAGANSNLAINDSTDAAVRVQHQSVTFLANYTNATSGALINGSDVGCEIRFNTSGAFGSYETMLFNTSRMLYEANRTFSEHGNFTYNVRCNGSAQSFETINATDALNITQDTTSPAVTQAGPQNGSTVIGSNVVAFVYNVSDDSGSLHNCSILVNGSVNGTAASPQPLVNQSINVTLENGGYLWQARCADNTNNTNTSGTFTLTVNVSNAAPALIMNLSNVSVAEDLNLSINLSAAFNDSNADPLTYTASHNGSLIVFTDNSTGNATVSGAANVSGIFSVIFTAHDPLDATGQSNTVTVNVTPVNDRPSLSSVIANQSWSQGSNRTSAFDLDNYFTDADNSTLTYT